MTTQSTVKALVAEAVAMAAAQGVEATAEQREQLAATARDALDSGATVETLRDALGVAEQIASGA